MRPLNPHDPTAMRPLDPRDPAEMRSFGNLPFRKRIVAMVALVVALVALAAGSAYAYFTATVASGGNGGAVAASLPQGNTPEVSVSGGSVTVTWVQSTVGGQRLGAYAGGGYTVKRYPAFGGSGVTPGTSCGTTIGGASEKLSCTEINVPPGSWKYTVTPVLNNWVGAESAQSAAVYRSSIALSPSSGGAGTGDSISGSGFAPNSTITATFGGSSVTLGGTTKTDGSGSFTGATYTVPGDAAGNYEVVVSDGSSHSASASYQVTFGPASQIVLSGSTESLVSGSGRTYTATIEDAAGNTVTGGPDATDGVTFSKTAGSGSVNGLATMAASEGVARDTVTGNKAGSVTIGASAIVNGEAASSNTLSFEVVAGPLSKFVLSAATTTPTEGTANNLTITANDANGNTVTTYTGSQSLVFGPTTLSSPDGTAPTVTNSSGASVPFGTATSINFTNGVASVSAGANGAMTLYKAGATSITVTQGAINNGTGLAVTVSAGAPTNYAWTSVKNSAGSLGALSSPCYYTCTDTKLGNNETLTANVSVTDKAGNIVSELGAGHTVTVAATPNQSGGEFTSPTKAQSVTLTIASTGAATSTATFSWKAGKTGTWTDKLAATTPTGGGTSYNSATMTMTKQ
jgi:hypothetical protein